MSWLVSGVQVAGGLVGEQHERAVHECAGDGDALLLTAGKFGGQSIGFAGQTDHVENLGHSARDDVAGLADDFQRKGHVLGDRLLLKQAEVLEHTAHALAKLRHAAGRQLVDVEIRDLDVAGRRRLHLEQQPHERRLAGAGGADEEDELPLLHLHTDLVERRPGGGLVGLRHILHADHN